MKRLFLVTVLVCGSMHLSAETLVFHNGIINSITNGVFEPGAVRVENGKIVEVGKVADVNLVADKVIDLEGQWLMPGLVDTHSHNGINSKPRTGSSDANERQGSLHPGLRALDAINPLDPGIKMALAGGITTANIMPGSGNVVGGQTAYIKYRGKTVEEMLIDNNGVFGGMKFANGENPKRRGAASSTAPGTRMASASMQREIFIKAGDYKAAWDNYNNSKKGEGKLPERDLGLEAVLEILAGNRVVHFHTHRADDIMTAIRLSEEFGFRLVLQHVTEGFKVADEIAKRNIPASIIVVDSPGGKHEVINLLPTNAAMLARAGVKIAFHTDDSVTDSRFFLRSAALAVRDGLDRKTALAALTINPAEMMDLGDRVGSLEPGKDADLIVLSGDPLSVYTKVLMTYIDGKKVFDRADPHDRKYATGGFALLVPTGESH